MCRVIFSPPQLHLTRAGTAAPNVPHTINYANPPLFCPVRPHQHLHQLTASFIPQHLHLLLHLPSSALLKGIKELLGL